MCVCVRASVRACAGFIMRLSILKNRSFMEKESKWYRKRNLHVCSISYYTFSPVCLLYLKLEVMGGKKKSWT